MGNKATPTTQTTKVELSPQQNELLNLAMPGFREFAANPPQRYQGSSVASFDPLQIQGQNMVLSSTGAQQNLANKAAGANEFLLGDALNPNSNPALQATIDASVRPITEQLTQQTLPAIRGEAINNGQFGGSRQGVAEGVASTGASRAVGDTAAKVATSGYNTGLEAMLKGLALTPQTQQAQTAPGTTTSAVGDVRQALSQAQLNDIISGYNYDQNLPFLTSQDLASIVSGLPTAGATATASGPQQNPFLAALGAASVGSTLGTTLFPATAGAGIGGAGLGALAALLSDRRFKRDSFVVGRLHNGLFVWAFKYVGSAVERLGLMADEVKRIRPEAIVPLLGVDMVDYELAGA